MKTKTHGLKSIGLLGSLLAMSGVSFAQQDGTHNLVTRETAQLITVWTDPDFDPALRIRIDCAE